MNLKRITTLVAIFVIVIFIFIYFYKLSSRTTSPKGMKEDVNHDGQIDIVDISMVGRAFGSKAGDPNWNPDADINKDGKVDDTDMYMVEEMFKKVTG